MDIPEKTITEVIRNTKTFNYFEIDNIVVKKKKAFVTVKLFMKAIDTTLNSPTVSMIGQIEVVVKQADFDDYVTSKLDDSWLLNYVSTYLANL